MKNESKYLKLLIPILKLFDINIKRQKRSKIYTYRKNEEPVYILILIRYQFMCNIYLKKIHLYLLIKSIKTSLFLNA